MRLDARFLVVALAWSGCVHTYETPGGAVDARVVDATVFVALPQPGSFAGEVYAQSGTQAREAIRAAMASRTRRAISGESAGSTEDARQAARAAGASHIVIPTILHWEERATEWSGKRDRIRLRLEVMTVDEGALLDDSEISGRSRWATFGGDHPQDLLPVPLEAWAARLFERSSP